MNEAWFDPRIVGWLPGTMLGVLAGVWGALVGSLAPRGKARGLVTAFTYGLLAASVVMLIAGVMALASGQPYGVWYGLGLPGVIGLTVIGLNLPNMNRVYRAAEERTMQADDLSF